MEVTKELMVEAIDHVFAAEEDIFSDDAKTRWKMVLAELSRHQRNLDFILSQLRDGWFEMEEPWCKVYVCAVVYRSVGNTLYGPGSWKRRKDTEFLRHWYKRRERAKSDLKTAMEQCRDRDMEKKGHHAVWRLMTKYHGHSHVMMTSHDKRLVMAEYNEAMRNVQPGTMYFLVKEYVPDGTAKKGGGDGK